MLWFAQAICSFLREKKKENFKKVKRANMQLRRKEKESEERNWEEKKGLKMMRKVEMNDWKMEEVFLRSEDLKVQRSERNATTILFLHIHPLLSFFKINWNIISNFMNNLNIEERERKECMYQRAVLIDLFNCKSSTFQKLCMTDQLSQQILQFLSFQRSSTLRPHRMLSIHS